MRYSVTGESNIRGLGPGIERMQEVVESLTDVSSFTTGGAVGVDSLAAIRARYAHPHALHRVCLPQGQHYSMHWRDEPHGYRYEYVPGGYMKRNDRLVAHADVLLAFPRTSEEVLRSGTWATIRRARKAGVEVRLTPLSG